MRVARSSEPALSSYKSSGHSATAKFDCNEVYVEKRGDSLILTAKAPSWDEFFALKPAFGLDFLADREDLPPQERDWS